MSRKTTTSDRIKDLILADGLRPGDLLPTEGELCARLGVSRSNVREAIRKLSTLDIVEVRAALDFGAAQDGKSFPQQDRAFHTGLLEAAQAGDVVAFHAAITVHYEPTARALDRDVN